MDRYIDKPNMKPSSRMYYCQSDYSEASIKDLKAKYNHLKKNIYFNNKWQDEEFFMYCENAGQDFEEVLFSLENFGIHYSSKIASLPSFNFFIKDLLFDIINIQSTRKYKRRKVELKDKDKLDELLIIVKQLKGQLKCSNEKIINIIYNNIDTGYSRQTLLKHYYLSNSEK